LTTMAMQQQTPEHRPLRRAALALTVRLALVVGAGAAPLLAFLPAAAQDLPAPGDGFAWERVGDYGLDVRDLVFGPDGTLWATAVRGVYRLDTTGGFPGFWNPFLDNGRFDAIIVLGRGP